MPIDCHEPSNLETGRDAVELSFRCGAHCADQRDEDVSVSARKRLMASVERQSVLIGRRQNCRNRNAMRSRNDQSGSIFTRHSRLCFAIDLRRICWAATCA